MLFDLEHPPVLDMTCGSRSMWFDKQNPNTVFFDQREETHTLCDGRTLTIQPDVQGDFRELPFPDDTFRLVVFDPPHLKHVGPEAYMRHKYGALEDTWREDLHQGFKEAFRVLQPLGVLVFKWNETQIPTREVLKLSPYPPLFGHRSGKASKTHWVTFMKDH